jgi:hypothetical protein
MNNLVKVFPGMVNVLVSVLMVLLVVLKDAIFTCFCMYFDWKSKMERKPQSWISIGPHLQDVWEATYILTFFAPAIAKMKRNARKFKTKLLGIRKKKRRKKGGKKSFNCFHTVWTRQEEIRRRKKKERGVNTVEIKLKKMTLMATSVS